MGGPHHELPWNVPHLAKSQKGKVKHIRYSQLWSLDHDWAIILMLKPQKRKKTSSKIFLSYHSKDRNKNDSFFFVFFFGGWSWLKVALIPAPKHWKRLVDHWKCLKNSFSLEQNRPRIWRYNHFFQHEPKNLYTLGIQQILYPKWRRHNLLSRSHHTFNPSFWVSMIVFRGCILYIPFNPVFQSSPRVDVLEVDGQFSGRFVASLASIARVESEKNLVTRFVDKEEIEQGKQHLPNASRVDM